MKTFLSTLIVVSIAVSAFGQEVVNIPDANFKAALLAIDGLDQNDDGQIQVAEAGAFTGEIDVLFDARYRDPSTKIRSLIGIEHFTQITLLHCSDNDLKYLDLRKNTQLVELDCSGNNFTSLDLSKNVNITSFYCSNAPLLESLNLKNGNDADFDDIEINDNPKLTCIQVDDPAGFKSAAEEEHFDIEEDYLDYIASDCFEYKELVSVVLKPSQSIDKPEGTLILEVVIQPEDVTFYPLLTWSVINPDVATINPLTGELKALKNGYSLVKIGFTLKGSGPTERSGRVEILNQPDPARERIELSIVGDVDKFYSSSTQALQMKARVFPDGISQEVEWSVTPEYLTIIHRKGMIILSGLDRAGGEVTVTATSVGRPDISATKKITILPLIERIDIEAPDFVISGSSIKMKATITSKGPGTGHIEWSVLETDISANIGPKEAVETTLSTLEGSFGQIVVRVIALDPWAKSTTKKITIIPSDFNALINELKDKETQVKDLTTEKGGLESQVKDLTTEKGGLESQVKDLTTEKGGLESQVKDLTTEKGGLETQVKDLTTEKGGLESQVKDLTTEKGGLESQVKDLTTEKDGLEKRATRLTTEKGGLEKRATRLTTEKDGLEAQVKDLTTEKDGLEKRATRLTTEKGGLEAQVKDLTTEKGGLETQVKDLTSEKGGLEAQVKDLTSEKGGLEAQVKDLTSEKGGLETQVKDLTSEKGGLETQVKDLTSEKGGLEKRATRLINEKGGLEAQVARLTTDKDALEKQVTRLATDKGGFETQVKGLTTEKGGLEAQVARLTTDKDALEKQVTRLATDKGGLETQVKGLTTDKGALEKQVATLTGELSDVKSKLDNCQSNNMVTGDISNRMEDNFRLFPNPVSDVLTISTSEVIMAQMRIKDVTGNTVKVIDKDARTVDISSLQSGTYLLHVQTNSGSIITKLIKE